MRFLLTCLWVWLIILRLPPTHHHDPSMTTVTGESPDTIRFASHALLDSYGVVVVDWKRSNRLRLKAQGIYRVHPRCGSVGEGEYLLLTADKKSQWFYPLCTQSVATCSLNLSGINSFASLQPKIVEVNTIQTNAKHPGVSETSLQHSGSHSENRAKKRSARNKNYYERQRILLKRKQRYQENTAAARVASEDNYKRNPEAKMLHV